jgi:hypothetical protein
VKRVWIIVAIALAITAFIFVLRSSHEKAFIVAALLELQDAPVDVCNLFHGELGGFGLFTEHGVPRKNYHALRAFRGLLDTPRRVEVHGALPGQLAWTAGLNANATEVGLLISNFSSPESDIRITPANLPWSGRTMVESGFVDATQNFDLIPSETNALSSAAILLRLKGPTVALIRLRPATNPK